MAGNYNKVILLGNITRDPELRHLQSGQAVATIGLAVNRRWRDQQSGENREETTFVDCEAWGRTAEVMCQYLGKGRPVFIEGRLRLDTWQDKDSGANRSKLKVVIENFQFVDSRGDGPGGGPSAGGGGGGQRRSFAGGGGGGSSGGGRGGQGGGGDMGHEPMGDDDIPF
ncbi:MAG: single-stranded DNA-binding protein [Phycisphaerales bacterium]